MPHVGFLIEGQTYSFEQAYEVARNDGSLFGFPAPVLMALRQTREDGGNHLAPSGASKCLRQPILKASNDYYLNPEQLWAAFVGTAVHQAIEAQEENTEMFLSMNLEVPVGDEVVVIPLQGTTDHYDPELKRITDHKTVSEYRKYDPRLKRGADRTAADDDHILQVNLYRMLLEANGYPVESAQVFYIQTYKEAKRNVFDIPLWDLEDTYQLAVQYATPLAVWQLTGELPPPLEEDDSRYWLCGRCPVADVCRRLAANGE